MNWSFSWSVPGPGTDNCGDPWCPCWIGRIPYKKIEQYKKSYRAFCDSEEDFVYLYRSREYIVIEPEES